MKKDPFVDEISVKNMIIDVLKFKRKIIILNFINIIYAFPKTYQLTFLEL
jgi:hypothetical protein